MIRTLANMLWRFAARLDPTIFSRAALFRIQDENVENMRIELGHPNAPHMIAAVVRDLSKDRQSTCAVTLRILGRLDASEVHPWGQALMGEMLALRDIEIRDAAISALEKWADAESLRILSAHRDPLDWLESYRVQVVKDIEGMKEKNG